MSAPASALSVNPAPRRTSALPRNIQDTAVVEGAPGPMKSKVNAKLSPRRTCQSYKLQTGTICVAHVATLILCQVPTLFRAKTDHLRHVLLAIEIY
jgi:hypothetical protein